MYPQLPKELQETSLSPRGGRWKLLWPWHKVAHARGQARGHGTIGDRVALVATGVFSSNPTRLCRGQGGAALQGEDLYGVAMAKMQGTASPQRNLSVSLR